MLPERIIRPSRHESRWARTTQKVGNLDTPRSKHGVLPRNLMILRIRTRHSVLVGAKGADPHGWIDLSSLARLERYGQPLLRHCKGPAGGVYWRYRRLT